jgi:hypothetical protein
MPEKLDLQALHKAEYVAAKTPVLLKIKPAKYLAISGSGMPDTPEFHADMEALYGVAYTMKMTKKAGGQDYKVPVLEGLWWGDVGAAAWPPEVWNWKLILRVPEFIGKNDVTAAIKKAREKGQEGPLDRVGLETIKEGECVQMLHVGTYEDERGVQLNLEHLLLLGNLEGIPEGLVVLRHHLHQDLPLRDRRNLGHAFLVGPHFPVGPDLFAEFRDRAALYEFHDHRGPFDRFAVQVGHFDAQLRHGRIGEGRQREDTGGQ